MLLSVFSEQITEVVQAVGQAVGQAEHHPEFLNPMSAS